MAKSIKNTEEPTDVQEKQKGGAKKTVMKKTSGSKTSKKTPSKKSSKSKDGNKKRYFKLIDARTMKTFGRYTGDTPKQAASKGYTKLVQKGKAKGKQPPKELVIYLRESTRNSNRKVYGYTASRVKLDDPQKLNIKDNDTGKEKTIIYNYRNKIKKVTVPEQIGGALKKKSSKKSSSKSKSSKSVPKKVSKSSSGSKTVKKTSKNSVSKKTSKKVVK